MEAKDRGVTAAGRYAQLAPARSPYIDRGKLVAAVTIPSQSPEELKSTSGELHTTSQGLGAEGTNNLSSKLMLAILPANTAFFRVYPNAEAKAEIEAAEAQSGEKLGTTIEKGLSRFEGRILEDIETSGDRVKIFSAMKQVLIVGNVLLDTHNNKLRVFTLPNYVVKRDPTGNVLETITREEVDASVLQESEKELYASLENDPVFREDRKQDKPILVYTRSHRKNGKWEVYQEVYGKKIPSSFGSFPIDAPRFIPLAPYRIDGEDYGRSYIEEFVGDLITLEYLTRYIKDGAAAAAKFFIFVSPNGYTVPQDLEDADNGDVIIGTAEDVTSFQLNKGADFQTARSIMEGIERRLERSFLMNAAIQRNAERVTAEEIRFMAEALEASLGGLYSVLAEDFQRPYISRKIHYLKRSGALKNFPINATRISIVTGVEALGRGNDRNKLVGYMRTLYETLGNTVAQVVNVGELCKRLAIADGIDIEGLIKSPEDMQREQQQSQMSQLTDRVAPEVVRQAGQALQQGANINQGEG